jgi:DegV family protein with EDD domain
MSDEGEPAATRPSIAYLDGIRLDRALRAGVRRVLAERQHLNKINVFPVPDGDTGTNLALTLSGIGAALAAHPSRSAGDVMIRVADAALDGARGNSGAIMAQFFQGLADQLGEYRRIGVNELSSALSAASAYARDALDKPLDGTVLTVIQDSARSAASLQQQGVEDIVAFMDGMLVAARESLESTRNGLEQMRKAGVVDAGASGFVMLLEGMADFVRTGSLRTADEAIEAPVGIPDENIVGGSEELSFRYCTECMVSGERIDRRRLREALSPMGNSMVIAGTHRKLKVHIHTNEPEEVFLRAADYGEVSATKADDMQQQTRTLSRKGRWAAVVADSAADLPDTAYEELDIHFVPLRINFGERSYLDKVSLPVEDFYAELETNPEHPQTSQPSPGDYRRVYEFLGSHFPEVITVSLSRAVSGTWQAASNAAERVQGNIIVVDSRSVSVGQGLVAMAAAEYAAAGYRGDALLDEVQQAVERTQSFGMVTDLTWGVRGGRVPAWQKRVAEFFGIVPILTMTEQGELRPTRIARRKGDLLAAMAKHVARKARGSGPKRVSIGHAGAPEKAARLASLLRGRLGEVESVSVVQVGATLGSHGGIGTLVVAVQDYRAPEPKETSPPE